MKRIARNVETTVVPLEQVGITLSELIGKIVSEQAAVGTLKEVLTMSHSVTPLADGQFMVSVAILFQVER